MSSIRRHISVVGFYLVLALLMSFPALGSIQTDLIGVGGDPWQVLWRFEEKASAWNTAQEQGELTSFARDEFFGGGEARLVNLSVWPWMWLHALIGQPMTYNTIWFLSYVLSGWGMYALARRLVSQKEAWQSGFSFAQDAPALIAGLFYMFLPYHVAHSFGHFGAMQIQWLPLALLAVWRWFDFPTIWRLLAFGTLFVLTAVSEHHYALWLAMSVLVVALFRFSDLRDPSVRSLRIAHVTLLAALLFFFVVLPYWPTVQLGGEPDSLLDLGQEQTIRFSADLFSYITPAPFHTLWGSVMEAIFSHRFTGNVFEATHFVGLVPLLLLLFFHQRLPKKDKWLWFTMAAVFFLITLGPRLHVMGRVLSLPLPYALFDGLPVLSSVRAVGRASVFVALSVGLLLALVLRSQLRRRGPAFLIGGLIVFEFLFAPVPTQSTQLSGVYEKVADWSGTAIIELPAPTNYTASSRGLYASRIHGKEVVGSIALERAEGDRLLEEIRSLPALRQFLYLRTTHLAEQRPDFFEQDFIQTFYETLTWLDVGGIVIHTDSLTVEQNAVVRQFLEEALGLQPELYDDVVAYELPVPLPAGDSVFAARDGQWLATGYDPLRDGVFSEIDRSASLTLYNTLDEVQEVQFSLTFPEESHGALRVSTGDRELARFSGVQGQRVSFTVKASPGTSVLLFENLLPERLVIQDPVLTVVDR